VWAGRASWVECGGNHPAMRSTLSLALVVVLAACRSAAPAEPEGLASLLERARAEVDAGTALDALVTLDDALALAPQDVRVTNDAALILVYHFPSRVAEAERLLLAAVEAGARQKDSGELPAQALDLLIEAWGDAHQNLGVLELVHRRNPARAREWFAKTVAIGPQPRVGREWVTQVALPACDALFQGQDIAPEDLDPRIALLE